MCVLIIFRKMVKFMGALKFMKEFLKEAEELAKELGEPLYLTKEEIYKRDMEKFKEQEKIKKTKC